jgi:uncharacterized protein YutE (UPF0331/DUF86 family)
MTDKLSRLEDNLKTLKTIKAHYTLDDFISDKVDEWGLRYGLFESIQIIIDITCHIVAQKNLGTPNNYSDCVSLLVSNNLLNENLAQKITGMIGLRNLIIHEYGIIDVKKLYDYLDHLDDISDFIHTVRETLKTMHHDD